MEARFGQDFGNVRVHAGGDAAASAKAINARAYTIGSNIAFAAGQYAPEAAPGRQLLAYERAPCGARPPAHRHRINITRRRRKQNLRLRDLPARSQQIPTTRPGREPLRPGIQVAKWLSDEAARQRLA
jgi:hypothetical protein